MNAKWIPMIATIVLVSAMGGYWLGHTPSTRGNTQEHAQATPKQDRTVLYWYDPMAPNQHFNQPGKSPFMDMQLVPKYAGESGGDSAAQSGIMIDSSMMQNLGARLTAVQRGVVAQPINAVGNIVFNQRDVAVVQARTTGFVERVYQRAPGDVIARNAPLVGLLVPEWAGAQAEFLALLNSNDSALIDAARQRLMLLGMSTELIANIEKNRQLQATITIRAPIAGVVDSLDVRAGMSLSAGATLAKINGLDTVWLEAQVPEAQLAQVSIGNTVTASLAAYPGEDFNGKVIAILPEATVETRTVRVRIELANPQQRLRPGLFAQVRLDNGDQASVLFVPSEAIIRSGTRNVVIVAMSANRFEPVEVQLGPEADGKTIILAGVKEGQQIVASGQFLIDSEASLQGVLTRLGASNAPSASAPTTVALHQASGKIEAISAAAVLISHGPVPSLGWGAMTMPFKIDHPQMVQSLQVGDSVKFVFEQQDDSYVLQQIQKLGSTP